MRFNPLLVFSLLPLLASCPAPDTRFELSISSMRSDYEPTKQDLEIITSGIGSFLNERTKLELQAIRANVIDPEQIRACGFVRLNGGKEYFFAGNLMKDEAGQRRFSVLTVDHYTEGDATKRLSGDEACGLK